MQRQHLLRSIAIGALFLLASSRSFGHSAIEPTPRGDQWWTDRHSSFNERVKELGSKADLIFIGDSITQGWESQGREVWEKQFSKHNAINLGIGGDRTQHVLWRFDNGNLDGLNPRVAVVMIGTNNSNGEDNSVDQIADGVTQIVKVLRQRLPNTQILLTSIFPRGENPNPQRGKILQVNQILQKLAEDSHVDWVDFGHRYVTAKGTIPRDLMPDFLHLSPEAYGMWASALEPYLDKYLGKPRAVNPFSGSWILTMPGPTGDPIDIPLELKADGSKVTGRIARGPGQWLDIVDGTQEGDTVKWRVRRDRDQGGSMIYRMNATIDQGKLSGTTLADVDGNEISLEWTARRAN